MDFSLEQPESFVKRARRVITVARKPRRDEFALTAKVTGLGMALIGLIGYLVALAFRLFGAF